MAGADNKKNMILGAVAGVLLLVAVVLIYRGMTGGGEAPPPPLDTNITEKLDEVPVNPDPVENVAPPGSGRLGGGR